MKKGIVFSALIFFSLFINSSSFNNYKLAAVKNIPLFFNYPKSLSSIYKNHLIIPEDKNKFDLVDSIINASIADSAFPSAVILIEKDGRIIHKKAFGYYTYDSTSGKVSVNTMYDLASLTKVIATTTATMICYDRGLFKLDDRVAEYLPKFGLNGKENVTIRNLLVHDSGLRPDIPSYKAFDSVKNKEQGVMDEIFNDTLIYPTGSKMVYSDLNFILMGK